MKKYFEDYLHKNRQSMVKRYVHGSVLDIGCGPATTYKEFNIKDYTGIERDKDYVKNLQEKYPKAKFYSRNILKDKLKLNKEFDTIFLIATIEHIKNPDLLYKEIKKHLKRDGLLVITTPTPLGNFIHTLLSYVGLTSKEAVKEHTNICNYKKFKIIAKKYDFKLIKYKRFEFLCNSIVIFGI